MKYILLLIIACLFNACDANVNKQTTTEPQKVDTAACKQDIQKEQFLINKFGKVHAIPNADNAFIVKADSSKVYYVHYNSNSCADYTFLEML